MDDNVIKAMLTVIVGDQAYLYASIQALKHKIDQGYDVDEETFNEWQDTFRAESTILIGDIAVSLLQEADTDDGDSMEYYGLIGAEDETQDDSD